MILILYPHFPSLVFLCCQEERALKQTIPNPFVTQESIMFGLEGYSLAVILPVAFVLYFLATLVYTAIYNVFFHPLAHVPGPKFAGATYLYQTYHSFVGGSRYYVKIKALHEIYGMAAARCRTY
jgi:hypothetical protein